MADEVDFEYDDSEWRDLADRAGTLLFENMRTALDVAAMLHERALKTLHRAPPAGGSGLIPVKSAGTSLSTITGGLLGPLSQGRELRGSTLSTLEMLRYIGRGIPYARIHEYGGEIRPVHARVLTIPTIHHRTQAGDQRGRAIHFAGHWVKTKKGSLLFFSDETGLPLFIGVTRVRIPPRLQFVALWEKGEEFRERMYVRATDDALSGKRYATGK